MREICKIVLHCSATPEDRYHDASDLDRWHRSRGWNGIGYHFVILLDGTVETGRPLERQGAHVRGHNKDSIGICYIGGVSADRTHPLDTMRKEQADSFLDLVEELREEFGHIPVMGHNDFPGVAKACPSFKVSEKFPNL